MEEAAVTMTIAVLVSALVVLMGVAAMGDTGRPRSRRRGRLARGLSIAGRAIAGQLEALRQDYRRLVAANEHRPDKRGVVDRVKDYGL